MSIFAFKYNPYSIFPEAEQMEQYEEMMHTPMYFTYPCKKSTLVAVMDLLKKSSYLFLEQAEYDGFNGQITIGAKRNEEAVKELTAILKQYFPAFLPQ